jgi:hypothetical protein
MAQTPNTGRNAATLDGFLVTSYQQFEYENM